MKMENTNARIDTPCAFKFIKLGIKKIQNGLKGAEDILRTARLMLNDRSDAELYEIRREPNMQQPTRQNDELKPTIDRTDELRVRFYNERDGQRVEIQRNVVSSRVNGLPELEGPSELHNDNRCYTSENPFTFLARNETSFPPLCDYTSVSQCYYVKYVTYYGYLPHIVECFFIFQYLSETIFRQPCTNVNFAIHFSFQININVTQTVETSSVHSTVLSSVHNVNDPFYNSTASVETSARSDIMNGAITRLKPESIMQTFRSQVTEAGSSGFPPELQNALQSAQNTPATLYSEGLATRSAMDLNGNESIPGSLSHQSRIKFKRTVDISSVHPAVISSVPNGDDLFCISAVNPSQLLSGLPKHCLSDKHGTPIETSGHYLMNCAISRLQHENKSIHERGFPVPNAGAVSGRRRLLRNPDSTTYLMNTSFSETETIISTESLVRNIASQHHQILTQITLKQHIDKILTMQLCDDINPNEEIMPVDSSSSNNLQILDRDAVGGRRISDFDCVDGKRRRRHLKLSNVLYFETIRVMKFDSIERDKIAQLQEARLRDINRISHKRDTDTTFVLGFKSEDTQILFQEDIYEAKESKGKTKPKYCLRLAVVTAEVFEEAMRHCQIFEYDLTYSNYFPRDCKMIIGIPVYKGGFINRRDNKDRGIT